MSAAAVAAIGLSTAAQADSYTYLKPAYLEQTVLRAQMPKTLGKWTQNYYFTLGAKNAVPTLCWNAQGDVNLPNAKIVGGVGYALANQGSGSVSIYQYANAAQAQAALKALQSADCADNPTITTDEGVKVPGQSGSDFTDSSQTGYAAGLTYPQGDKIITQSVYTTQRGLAVIQTEVLVVSPKSASDSTLQSVANKAGATTKAWQAAAVKAYEAFGQGNAR